MRLQLPKFIIFSLLPLLLSNTLYPSNSSSIQWKLTQPRIILAQKTAKNKEEVWDWLAALNRDTEALKQLEKGQSKYQALEKAIEKLKEKIRTEIRAREAKMSKRNSYSRRLKRLLIKMVYP